MRINQGPYFKGARSTFGGIGAFFSLLIFGSFIHFTQSNMLLLIPSILVGLFVMWVCISIFLGVEGVEFDMEKGLVRKYVKFLWMRQGEWEDAAGYTQIVLDIDRYSYNSATPTSYQTNQNRSFDVSLADLTGQKRIFLEECRTYPEGKRRLRHFCEMLDLPGKDLFAEELGKKRTRR